MFGCQGRALTWKAVSPRARSLHWRARSVHERARVLRPRARAGHGADRFVSGSAQYPLAHRPQSNVTRMRAAGGVTLGRQRSATLQPGLTKARRYDGKYRAAYATASSGAGLAPAPFPCRLPCPCGQHAGVDHHVFQARVLTGRRGSRALRWSCRAFWSSMKPGAAFELPVWAAIVLDREAPARATGGAASRGGLGSPWPWAVLAWAVLLAATVVSFRPAVPVIWGDTPSFVESALLTLEAGRPTVAGGRDPGYPAFLAVTFW